MSTSLAFLTAMADDPRVVEIDAATATAIQTLKTLRQTAGALHEELQDQILAEEDPQIDNQLQMLAGYVRFIDEAAAQARDKLQQIAQNTKRYPAELARAIATVTTLMAPPQPPAS